MKSTPMLIPRPVEILNKPIGVKVPINLGTPRVPYEKVQRLRSIESPAPENAAEAVNGLGTFAPTWGFRSWKKERPSTGNVPYRPTVERAPAPASPFTQLNISPSHRPTTSSAPASGPIYASYGYGPRPFYGYNPHGWMAFNGLGNDPQPAAQPSIWSSINDALSQPAVGKLVTTGTNFYVQRQTNEQQQALLNAQAQTAAIQAQIARRNAELAATADQKPGMPKWVIPAVAIGGVALVATFFLVRK